MIFFSEWIEWNPVRNRSCSRFVALSRQLRNDCEAKSASLVAMADESFDARAMACSVKRDDMMSLESEARDQMTKY